MSFKSIKIGTEYPIRISMGNTKIGKIANISLPPVLTCNKKAGCTKGKCYALKAYRQYPLVRQAWNENWDAYNNLGMSYFSTIFDWLSKKKDKIELFRWHVGGDVPDQNYAKGVEAVACLLPSIKFLLFSKKYNIKWTDENKNLTIIMSAWPGLKMPDDIYESSQFPIAWMQDGTETRVPKSRKVIECHGKCDECAECWDLKNSGKDVMFNEH